jgi:hypothetical protein
MEPSGPPATGDGRLTAGAPTGRKLSVSSINGPHGMGGPDGAVEQCSATHTGQICIAAHMPEA